MGVGGRLKIKRYGKPAGRVVPTPPAAGTRGDFFNLFSNASLLVLIVYLILTNSLNISSIDSTFPVLPPYYLTLN